jgi:pyruvate formate lyase activating enzyme
MIGRTMTVREVMEDVLKDRIFYEDSKGGVTISGGEPLMQPQFLKALLAALRETGIHATLDTTGFGCTDHLLEAAKLADLVLYDLKAFDEQRHRELTGVTNRNILANLTALNEVHRNVWIRLPFVPGFNDDLVELRKIAQFVSGLRCVTLVNLLPFHRSGLHKYERLGQVHGLHGVEVPSEEAMERAADVFREFKLPVKIGG